MHRLMVSAGAMLMFVVTGPSFAQGPPAQNPAPAAQAGERGRGPQRPPLLPTPPLTARPTPDTEGNFVIGPPYEPAPELTVKEDVPKGTVHEFTMDSKDSKIYPGIARNRPGEVVPYHAASRRLRPGEVRRWHTDPVHRRAGRHVAELSWQPPADPRQPHS